MHDIQVQSTSNTSIDRFLITLRDMSRIDLTNLGLEQQNSQKAKAAIS